MREILFRAWWKDGGGLVCQNDYVIRPNGAIEFPEGGWDLWGSDDSDLVVLEQFTGVVDKNGQKIFEGDIFNLGDKDILYIVVWSDTGFRGRQTRSTSYVGLEYWKDKIEVSGNIHDNPELLEAK